MRARWPGARKARTQCRVQMQLAREACARYRDTGDPIYLDIARVHRMTARNFHRNAWRGPKP